VSLSVKDPEYFNELREEVNASQVVASSSTLEFRGYIPYPHIHFTTDGIEFLVKLDEK
jgi:hypothetical protein